VIKIFGRYAGLAAAIFTALAVRDQYFADEPFNFLEFLIEDAPEWLLMAVAVTLAVYALFRLKQTLVERNGLASALVQATDERNRWRETARHHSDGLGQAIRQQFSAWGLSASESDVALLMLKGLSHKEIARLRNSSSATVRQQAAAVYLKSGLSSRAELAAYFLEDLFPSAEARGPMGEEAVLQSDIRYKPARESVRETATGAI
jgi:DNA-binding CsgD family transcriptional regulator